ncbi:toxin-antitoxin system, toxin component [Streptomyces sp. NPDC088747]|uniref:toxin-antitoxin system, toxin component n=1 Tax=Streptomyces sp. NPDC088747 TaxID=3365886 RepID=UPI0038143111
MSLGRRIRAFTAALRPAGADSEMRRLAVDLGRALRRRVDTPVDVRELARALCEEVSGRRDGRPVQLRFERFPDEFEVTGLWMEFHDFDLVVIEERAETVQQLVILGHELWHMRQGHHNRHVDATAAASALSHGAAWQEIALTVAARNGSHAGHEAEAEDFGLHLASVFRSWVTGPGAERQGPADPVGRAIQASLGYRGPRD